MGFSSEVLTLEVDGHVATLWLDNPSKRNAMGPAFWADLPAAMAEVEANFEIRALVIAAKGKSFTAGLDLTSMGGELSGGGEKSSPALAASKSLALIKRLQASITSVADVSIPVIAAVHSHCIGGGIDLITACDIRLASADAIFSVRETKIAIVADVGTLQRLPKVITQGHAAELVYTGKDIGADRAREIGLVNDVLPDHDAVVKAAHEMAAEIAANSPLAVRGSKTVLRAGEDMSTQQALDYVALWNSTQLRSDDLTEAMTAYMEGRPPVFTGR